MHTVTMYTTDTCHYCHLAKDYFKANNVPYNEFNVGTDMVKRKEMMEISKQLGVPVIKIDDTVVVGFDQSKIAGLLGLAA